MREITHQIITVIYLIGVCFSGVVFAKVDVELAGKLGGELTYAGAETKANANGEIPAYAGGLPEPPACFVAGKGLCNPFPDDKIKFTINQENVERYKDNLSLGQIAMIKKYDTFHINVYQTRRTAIHPEFVKLATKINATQANMADGGSGLQNFDAKGFPFPVPQNGLEVIWNHIVRYRGKSLRRLTGQAAPLSNGKYSIVLFEDQVAFSAFLGDTGQGDKDSN
ncbi:MAG: DUF1329 domain-containing protein, partial [Pseudomonadales bacterium]|nr:DUF1329 domain-containing protein [Pseudomonadales bacterium]